ncbi:MAG: hypothetical protein JW888_08475, partial [Pirellulales bacterium]|nr:hypothetical protein [Pirellulales bacterium]
EEASRVPCHACRGHASGARVALIGWPDKARCGICMRELVVALNQGDGTARPETVEQEIIGKQRGRVSEVVSRVTRELQNGPHCFCEAAAQKK